MTTIPNTPAYRKASSEFYRRQRILARIDAGETRAAIAKDLGISGPAVSQLVARARKDREQQQQ